MLKKKYFLFLILIFAMLSACSVEITNSSNDIKFIPITPQLSDTPLEYKVTAISSGEEIELGKYTISYSAEANTITESKLYNIELSGENVEVENIKQYTYNGTKLINYCESEKCNGELNFSKSISVDYQSDSDEILVEIIENGSEPNVFSLADKALPYTVNSSYILSLTKTGTDSIEEAWSCYEGKGYTDNYEFSGTENIGNSLLGNVDCNKITQHGLFDTAYYICEDGIIPRIEQKMDENYTVTFELTNI